MKVNRHNLFLILFGLLVVNACNNSNITQAPTSSPISPTETTTSVLIPTETITSPTPTPLLPPTVETTSEWLPYNPNISDEGCGEFTAKLPVKGTEGWSEEEIGRKLFEIYLEHFKSPSLGGRCRLESFIIEETKFDQMVAFLTKDQKMDFTVTVLYSVQIQEVPSDWVAGNGESALDGWIMHKFLIIGVIKDNEQYVLHLIGTGP
jgi:hypothetical protein